MHKPTNWKLLRLKKVRLQLLTFATEFQEIEDDPREDTIVFDFLLLADRLKERITEIEKKDL